MCVCVNVCVFGADHPVDMCADSVFAFVMCVDSVSLLCLFHTLPSFENCIS